jgi:hypothetical protein
MKKIILALLLIVTGYTNSQTKIKYNQFQSVFGNNTTFLGSTDNYPLAIKINSVMVATFSNNVLSVGGLPNLLAVPTDTAPHLFEIVNDNKSEQMFRMMAIGDNVYENNMHFCRARGTAAAPTPLLNDTYIYSFGMRGQYDNGVGNMSGSQAAYQVLTTENWSATNRGLKFQWQVTPNGSTTRSQAMELYGTGSLRLTKSTSYTPYRDITPLIIDKVSYTGDFGMLIQSSTTNGAGIILGEDASGHEGYIVRYGSAYSGNHAGTSFPIANSITFQNGNSAQYPIFTAGSDIVGVIGSTSTNAAYRLSANGFKICPVSDINNTTIPTATLEVTGTASISAKTSIGNAVNTNQRVLRIGENTASIDVGSLVGSTSNGAIYFNSYLEAPSLTNYALAGTNGETFLNVKSGGSVYARVANSNIVTVNSTGATITGSLGVSTTATITGGLIYGTTNANFLQLDNSIGSKLAYNSNNLWQVGNTTAGLSLNGVSAQAWNTSGSALNGTLTASGTATINGIKIGAGLVQSNSTNLELNATSRLYLETGGTARGVVTATGLRVGSNVDPTETLDVTGTMSVSSTSSVNGLQLSSGGYTVTSKTINTTSGDAATIDSPIGRVRKDNTGTVFTLTNSFITANSIIMITFASDPGPNPTHAVWVTAGSGSCTINFDAAPNECDINFMIMN